MRRRHTSTVSKALAAVLVASLLGMLLSLQNASAADAVAGVAPTPDGNGYWTVSPAGIVNVSGDAVMYGDMSGKHLNQPMVGIAATPSGHGYWLLASDGGVFTYGDAVFYGSTGSMKLNSPVVGMASTFSGQGYWLVASDGGIFSFGDAKFYGSTGAIKLNKPVVGMTATPSGHGYWLVASDGGIFSYGDAAFHGSTGSMKLNAPIVGMAATTTGNGYWLVATDGGIFSYGDATFYGRPTGRTALGIVRTSNGYTVLLSTGAPATYGPADGGGTTTTTSTSTSTSTSTTSTTVGGGGGTVQGQNELICDQPSQLTSPWTYHALGSGSQTYTVAQYQALAGYGTTLPPLPSYISGQGAGATAAAIFAPGATTNLPGYALPRTPILGFFEGGNYGALSIQAVNGDVFYGGSTTGFGEPKFDDGGNADGISAQNDSFAFVGGASTLASTATAGATTINMTASIPGYINYVTLADGSTYSITGGSGTSLTLGSPVLNTQASGSQVWANGTRPIGNVASSASQGATSLTVSNATTAFAQWYSVTIGSKIYTLASASGGGSNYTIGVDGLDNDVAANTPIYYGASAGNVTVSYLDINNDQHNTTGTIYTGSGWTISHNKIHDGYSTPGMGVAIYGGDEGIVEYNCLSRMGDYGINVFGHNNKFRDNEVYQTNYEPDPGCGCSGAGKWWGSLNADITDNAFIEDSPGDSLVIWLDNGNSGTLISGNYFDKSAASAVHSETGFNLDITNNLFNDGGWGSGNGCGDSNCVGAVNLNSSGGFHVPGSRYDNEILVSNNQFINNWGGVDIWQSGGRSCENSGEGWPEDAAYCSGGFPVTGETSSGGQYYFSHYGSTTNQGAGTLTQPITAGSTTVQIRGAAAINDQIGFADAAQTTTASTVNVSTLSGTQTINAASTAAFPSSGQLRVGSSAAWSDGGGSWTGAILSYAGKTATTFTGVSLVRGSGTLSGPVWQVQPYKVVSESCYSNDCALTVSPAVASSVAAGSDVTNAGTCQLFATSAATPTSPLAPNGGGSYYDGCQWGTKNISVTGNTFSFDPTYIASHAPLNGGGTTTSCTSAHINSCGTNFQAFQEAGEAPFSSFINGNSMMSNSNLTSCPTWDATCTTSPLKNINTLSNAPSAPANNGEPANNIVWANNTYNGPWQWNVYWYGTCGQLPSDPANSHVMPSGGCSLDFTHWQSSWQQEAGSTSTP